MKNAQQALCCNKPGETGSSNPDPTMKPSSGSPKGENMPPRGGEDIAPAEGTRSPQEVQTQIKRDEEKPRD